MPASSPLPLSLRPSRRARRLRQLAVWSVAALLAGASAAQDPTADEPRPPVEAPRAAFDLQVTAPGEVKALLERHLELRRYRELDDLDDAELSRLLVLAENDARELLATLGYFNPRVELARRPGTPLTVAIDVMPGEPARVSGVSVDFEGDIASSADAAVARQREAIRSDWRLPAGQRFTQEAWDAAKSAATRQLTGQRYLRGQLTESVADVDAAAGQVGLGLKFDSGPRFRFGATQVTGVERYDPLLVPRLARLAQGADYDQERVQQAQLRLAGSGYFDSAFIFIDPDGDPAAVPVQVNVREAPLNKVVVGIGLTTDSGARLSLEHRHNRVPGIGWRAVTKAQAERKSPFIETEWTAVPDDDGWRWGVLARAERIDDDSQVTQGRRLRFGRSFTGDRIDRNIYAQYDRAVVRSYEGAPPAADTGDGTAVSANFVWVGRYFDRLALPSSGFGFGAEVGGGVTLTGSRSPFQRTVVRGVAFYPLERGRLQFRGEAGAVLARDTARVPATQLFRTGGDTSVRGYGFRDIGIALPGGVVGPGRYLAVASAEWQRPIRSGGVETPWENTFFIDSGAVAEKPGQLRPVYGVGTGIRYKSPIGPLQADIAWGAKTRKLRLHLNVGVTF